MLEIALEGAAWGGASTLLLDLKELNLPFAGSNWLPEAFPDVARMNEIIGQADALIWATPEYHGSFSGAFKNALDLGSFKEYGGKMVGLIGTAGGSMGAGSSLGHLRSVARQLHAWVLPQQVSVSSSSTALDAEGNIIDADIEDRLKALGRQTARYARLHAQMEDLEDN
jgi:FMN reductase